MRRTPSRMPRLSTGTCRRVLLLSAIGSLLLLAGCGASAESPRLSSATCSAARAAMATPIALPPTAPTGAQLSYARLALGPLPLQLVYHPGATLRITWCALPDVSRISTQPVPETLTAGFIGPFATRAAATADQLPSSPPSPTSGSPHNFPPPGPLAASTIPIHTTTWSSSDTSAPLTVPATLAAGYYIFFAQDDQGDISVQACAAVMVGACRSNGGVSQIVQITRA